MNERPELGINFNDLPAGSFIIKDGKLLPNLDDSAMAERNVIANGVKQSAVENKDVKIISAADADCSDA